MNPRLIESNIIIKNLETLGLTPNQSKVIVAIAKLGSSDASNIVLKSGVPRGKIYSILSELVDLDLIERDKTNERIYNFRGTQHVITTLKIESKKYQERIEKAAEVSEKFLSDFEQESDSKQTQEIWIYEGLANIIPYLESAILNSDQTIYGSINEHIFKKIYKTSEIAIDNGTNVHLLIEKSEIPDILNEKSQILKNSLIFSINELQKGIRFLSKGIITPEKNSFTDLLEDLEIFYFNRPSFLIIDDKFSYVILKSIKEKIDYIAIKFGNSEVVKTQKNVAEWVWRLLISFKKNKI